MRGPVGNLIQALEIINSDNKVDEDFKNLLLVNLLKSSGTTFSLSDNLLNWARNQTNSIKIKSKRYFLNQSINENVDLFSPLADNKSITILINMPEKL